MRASFSLFLFFFFVALNQSWSQADSSYIRNYPNELQALSTIRYSQSNIGISGHRNGDLGFEQGGVSVGARVRFGNWQVAVMAPTRLFSANRKGRSLGFQLQLFPKHFLLNAGAIRKTGFQDIEAGQDIITNQPINRNMKMWHFYVNPIYVLSDDKFSLRSTMQFTQRQLKSSGSFLGSLRSEYLRLSSESLIPENNSASNNAFTGYNFLQNGIEIGYAYNLVFLDGAFISAMATGGVAHTKTSYNLDEEKYAFQQWQFVPAANFNVSAGYNGDKYVAALRFNYRQRNIHSENIEMNVNDWSVQLTCGFRLYAPQIRRKLDQQGARFAQHFVPVR
ncbi:MAG: DUF4421 family protein [Saprospiraceae bacterium]